MKKILLVGLFMCISLTTFGQKKGFKVSVKSEIKGCVVALINKNEVTDKAEYGWWSVWKAYKEAKKYKPVPATFAGVAQGKYIVVIYNPASTSFDPNNGKPEEAADGVVIEELEVNKNISLTIKKTEFKNWYCLSCPFLYVWNGMEYTKICEVIKDVVGKNAESTSKTRLAHTQIIDGKVRIRIQEEKEETSYLNSLVLKVGKQTYLPTQTDLQKNDAQYHILKKGERIEITFELKEMPAENTEIILETTGYYEPNQAFLNQIYQQYLRAR